MSGLSWHLREQLMLETLADVMWVVSILVVQPGKHLGISLLSALQLPGSIRRTSLKNISKGENEMAGRGGLSCSGDIH